MEYSINPGESSSNQLMRETLLAFIQSILSIENASARAVNAVLTKFLYNRGAYVGASLFFSPSQYKELDQLIASKIRLRAKRVKSSQTETGGQDYVSVSLPPFSTGSKPALTVFSPPLTTSLGGHGFPEHLRFHSITPQDARPGYYFQPPRIWTERKRLSYQTTGRPFLLQSLSLHQALVGSPIPGHTWTSSSVKTVHTLHLSTYSDLFVWDGTARSWSWMWRYA